MKSYLSVHPWKIVEQDFHPENQRISESIFSLGNGRFGQRGNFVEHFSGVSLQGNYVAGIYYPDKTRVGWWKNGYPEYFAKVLNSVSWTNLAWTANEELIDLASCKISNFTRELDMRNGILQRICTIESPQGKIFNLECRRFCSISNTELACLEYRIKSVNFEGSITIDSIIDFDVRNADSNYDEDFWEAVESHSEGAFQFIQAKTLKTDFHVACGSFTTVHHKNKGLDSNHSANHPRSCSSQFKIDIQSGDELVLTKTVCINSSLFIDAPELKDHLKMQIANGLNANFEQHAKDHSLAWQKRWDHNDIQIDGDDKAQQAIRFNIFQLQQTYDGSDARLNIGPKGFTGEKYGGSTYWDTEAYCVPFFLGTSPSKVTHNLLMYRYHHLNKAIENAEKLGFQHGAALYPMVTMNGEECHNEWEITFEEIHRNGAIAYAIYDYIKYTGDDSYLVPYGLEVLIGISRFWKQRCNWSNAKHAYVILGVTGPNEYENNVNNNWYTNYIARWTLQYSISCLKNLSDADEEVIKSKTNLQDEEIQKWQEIADGLYLPFDQERNIFVQHDGFFDKELLPVHHIPKDQQPIHQHWSWDRILRSVYIKQADVLQGLYFFENEFDLETIKRNFNFYEPFTVHESSLSPCVHAILACKIGNIDKAYEMYLRTARLDLDDYNNDTEDGLHITSMGGTWMSIIKGFAGMRIINDTLSFKSLLPPAWKGIAFRLMFRERILLIEIDQNNCSVKLLQGEPLSVIVNDQELALQPEAHENKVNPAR